MRGKRGWIRILEATIAVMLVASVMLVSYSGQVGDDVSVAEYSRSWQQQILADISLRTDLRLSVLNVVLNSLDDASYVILNDFIMSKVPSSFGYLLRVCEFGNLDDYCRMDGVNYIATLEDDVFVEEVVISAEVGEGEGEQVYSPKRVRLFFWEGGFSEDFCIDECSVEGSFVDSCSGNSVSRKTCEDSDNDGCLEYDNVDIEDCGSEACSAGACTVAAVGYHELSCEKKVITKSDECVWNYNDECDSYDGGGVTGSCGFFKDRYECWNMETEVTGCEVDPACSSGYSEVSSNPCTFVEPCSDTCTGDSYSCSGGDVFKKTCADYNVDGCVEYGANVLFKDCVEGEVCSGEDCVAEVVGCSPECSVNSAVCSSDKTSIIRKDCGDYNGDGCLEYGTAYFDYCQSDEECLNGVCIASCSNDCTADESSCSSDYSSINTKTCGYYDADSCLDYGGTIVEACGTGKICSGGICVANVASLSASYVIGNKVGNRYYYDVTLTESNGVAVTVNAGERCFSSTSLCFDYIPSFVIPASGSITRVNQYFDTPYIDTVTYTYSGTKSESVSFDISTGEY